MNERLDYARLYEVVLRRLGPLRIDEDDADPVAPPGTASEAA